MGCTSNKVLESKINYNKEKPKQNKEVENEKETDEKMNKNNLKMGQDKENIKDRKIKEKEETKVKKDVKKQIEESEPLLLRIKSKYILDNIIDYIENKIFMLKFATYSKKLQKKLNYEFIFYQNYYFTKLQMMPVYYFFTHLMKCRISLLR